jgi:hypothetical protein
MKTTIKSHFSQSLAALALVVFCTNLGFAAPINYLDKSDIPPGSVTFTQVTESSGTDPVPLYTEPTAVANNLVFTPGGFSSSSAGGGGDVTDGQLNFGLEAESGTALTNVKISEGGNYTLVGSGTDVSFVYAGLFMQVTIFEVDGSLVSPIVVNVSEADDFNLVDHPGASKSWNQIANIDLLQALDDANQDYSLGVTKANVVLNDTLVSISEAGSVALVTKDSFVVEMTAVVPEPTTALLAVLAFSSIGLIAGRRRG